MSAKNLARRAAMEYLQLRDRVTVPELARQLRLPVSTAMGILSRLSDSGVLMRAGTLAGKRGRPVVTFRPRLPAKLAACRLDGTQLSAGIIDEELNVLTFEALDLLRPPTPAEAQAHLEELLPKLLSRCGLKAKSLFMVALGVNAAAIDNRLPLSSVLPWTKDELAGSVRKLAGLPVTMLIRSAVVAPYMKMEDPTTSLCCFSSGEGISAHVVESGHLLKGRHNLAGELGHVTVDPDGPLCGCGRRGCLEVFSSGPAIRRTIINGLEAGVKSELLLKAIRNSSPRQTLEHVWQAWQSGDSFARGAMDTVLDRLAWGLGLVINLFDPDETVAGGYVLQHRQQWIDEVQQRASRWILHAGQRPTTLRSSTVTPEDELRALAIGVHSITVPEESATRTRRRSRKAGGR
jgi:glucokinase